MKQVITISWRGKYSPIFLYQNLWLTLCLLLTRLKNQHRCSFGSGQLAPTMNRIRTSAINELKVPKRRKRCMVLGVLSFNQALGGRNIKQESDLHPKSKRNKSFRIFSPSINHSSHHHPKASVLQNIYVQSPFS
jgi:hypothetical protein